MSVDEGENRIFAENFLRALKNAELIEISETIPNEYMAIIERLNWSNQILKKKLDQYATEETQERYQQTLSQFGFNGRELFHETVVMIFASFSGLVEILKKYLFHILSENLGVKKTDSFGTMLGKILDASYSDESEKKNIRERFLTKLRNISVHDDWYYNDDTLQITYKDDGVEITTTFTELAKDLVNFASIVSHIGITINREYNS